MSDLVTETAEGVMIAVRIQPGAPRSEVVGRLGDAVKIKVAAPAVEGKANEECRHFLADLLKIPRGSIEIIKGATSRNKVICIRNVSAGRVRDSLGI